MFAWKYVSAECKDVETINGVKPAMKRRDHEVDQENMIRLVE
jgi:hypothetical protein